MDLTSFKRALASFADERSDLDLAQGQLIVQIREELIEATVTEQEGDVFVKENDARLRAYEWLIKRVAKLPQLATRIISHVPPEPHFITPAGKVLDHLEDDQGGERPVDDAPSEIVRLLDNSPAGTSTVLYVTSDAGEGKTTVIDQVARLQAQKYKSGKANWILLPLRLGGRSFLAFDDVVVAELVNRFRFQFFYYDAFLELVRLGVIVPAFDGFEELFVEGSTGEAVSSLGNLVRTFESSGAVVIAVRKAHFEYHSFGDQARTFDVIKDVDASFARLSLDRWNRERFLEYGCRRGLSDAQRVYEAVRTRLETDDHPVLTRAVLAKRLVDVAEVNDLDKLLEKLGTAVGDYFYHFVNAIVEREVQEKWIDRSGVPYQALLTVDEHHELLRMIAKEMWITSSDLLNVEYLELVAELFAEEFDKPALILRQIVNRLGQHSLIAVNRTTPLSYSFDHHDFQMFYWGEAIARMFFQVSDPSELGIYLGKRALPGVAADAAVAAMKRTHENLVNALDLLGKVALVDSTVSYAAENAAALAIRILDVLSDARGAKLCRFHFTTDAMRRKSITGATFEDCTFAPTSLEGTTLSKLRFFRCTFDDIQLGEATSDDIQLREATSILDVKLDECSVACVRVNESELYDPARIIHTLRGYGFSMEDESDADARQDEEPDELIAIAVRALRTFMRSTAVNERALARRLGVAFPKFESEVLPQMLEHKVLKEVEYSGGGRPQRRFKLATSMQSIERSLSRGGNLSLKGFLRTLR